MVPNSPYVDIVFKHPPPMVALLAIAPIIQLLYPPPMVDLQAPEPLIKFPRPPATVEQVAPNTTFKCPPATVECAADPVFS